LFANAERLIRELTDHLDKGVLPKLVDLERLLRGASEPGRRDELSDPTVRSHAAGILSADDFTESLCWQLDEYLQAIDRALTKTLG
jgi:hypothetical protein